MRLYIEPSYDFDKTYQRAPLLLLLADHLVFYGTIEPAIVVRSPAGIDHIATKKQRDAFKKLIREKWCSVVVRQGWYDQDSRLGFIDNRRQKNKPFPWDYDVAKPLDSDSFWTDFDDELKASAASACLDFDRPFPHVTDQPTASGLTLLPNDFTRPAEEFVETLLSSTDQKVRSSIWAIASKLQPGGFFSRQYGTLAEKRPLVYQKIHDFYNDSVAMAAVGATLPSVPTDIAEGLAATRSFLEQSLRPRSKQETELPQDALQEGAARILEAEQESCKLSLPIAIREPADVQKILEAREAKRIRKLRAWFASTPLHTATVSASLNELERVRRDLGTILSRTYDPQRVRELLKEAGEFLFAGVSIAHMLNLYLAIPFLAAGSGCLYGGLKSYLSDTKQSEQVDAALRLRTLVLGHPTDLLPKLT
ncbi:MAG: hypothetical protein JXQ75_18310 [Phycisphaerae bacterium]|nr:hypothetical protein [Phycisphaerae bacterium]